MKAIRAAAHIGVDQRCLQIVFAEEPGESPACPRWPLEAVVGPRRCEAGGNCRQRLDRLLVECFGSLAQIAETLCSDRPEAAGWRRLQRHQPAQRSQASLDIVRPSGCQAGLDHRLRQARIVVGEAVLEPAPIFGFRGGEQGQQSVSQLHAQILCERISRKLRAIGLEPEECERPSTRRREVLDGGKRGLEQRRGPSAASRVRTRASVVGQRPERPPMTVLRARRLQPSAVVAHEIAEAAGVRIPRVLNECRKTRRERLGQWRLATTQQRRREKQSARVVIDAIAVGAVRHRED